MEVEEDKMCPMFIALEVRYSLSLGNMEKKEVVSFF